MRHGSLFSGIGGFDLAAEWMGWENVFHCEIDPICQKILKKNFSNVTLHEDINKTDFNIYRRELDIVTAGFPCQPFSIAGRQQGTEDARYLWPETLRAVGEIQSRWVLLENVYGLLNWSKGLVFEQVCAELEYEGYQVAPFILPASAIGTVHRRDRIFWVAFKTAYKEDEEGWYCTKCKLPVFEGCGCNHGEWECKDCEEFTYPFYFDIDDGCSHCGSGDVAYAFGERGCSREFERKYAVHVDTRGEDFRPFEYAAKWTTEPPLCRDYDGIPGRLDRIKALGNAVVPQIVFEIFKAIEEYESRL